jgi:hypothetical protein
MVDADFPAALWRGYDKHGIRPEYQVACLNGESGINPAALNSIGCAGINQICPNVWPIPAGYSSWTASQQLDKIVTPMWTNWVSQYGPIDSGTRLEQCNFYPASMAYAKEIDDVIVAANSSSAGARAAYAANRGTFDALNTGAITPRGIAAFLRYRWTPGCATIVANAYALRPAGITFGHERRLGAPPSVPMGDIGGPNDPVLGTDYGIGSNYGPSWLRAVGVVGVAAAVALALGMAVDKWVRR